VAQTASLQPGEPLDCSFPGAVVLPQNDTFGDGSEPLSLLATGSYGPGEGPGLYLIARDAFRVYLNGDLVVTSDAARESVFVPLTLLPGDNALSIVIAAGSGTPAALVRVDELERSYDSDSSWRVSTAPGAGFALPGYDDSEWARASDYGVAEALPGCEPDQTFPDESDARWIGPESGLGSVAVLRRVIRVAPVGFGQATTGGEGSKPVLVDSWDELLAAVRDEQPLTILLPEGELDFRNTPQDQDACPSTCTENPDKQQYQVLTSSETCAVDLVTRTRRERELPIGSNKTVAGLGRGALVRGVNFDIGASQNVIVRNVALFDVNPDLIEAGDAFTLGGASNVWLDHCTTKWISDGFSDISAGTEGVTLSWMRYDGVTPSACEGQHVRTAQITDSTVTFHHCFFDHVESNSPSVRDPLSRVHLFNNLFSDNRRYAVQANCGAQILLERNTFQRVATPTNRSTCADETHLGLIDAPAGSNFYDDDVGDHHGGDNTEPRDDVFTPPYEYTLEPANDSWLTVLSRAGAGAHWALPLAALSN
jgi:pectate lyase